MTSDQPDPAHATSARPAVGDPPAVGSGQPRLDTSRPHPARRYDYWLGGKNNFAADRASADQIAQAFPGIRTAALDNRRFLRRAVGYLAGPAGIDQFLDIGAGLPTASNVHQIAQQHQPAARVVYVDNDPMVLAHARTKLTSTRPGAVGYAQADLRDPDSILDHPAVREILDLGRSVGLLLIAVLHFLDDHHHPRQAVARLAARGQPPRAVPRHPRSAARLRRRPAGRADRPRHRARHLPAPHPRPDRRPAARADPARPWPGPTPQWRPDQPPAPQEAAVPAAGYAAVARLP